MALLYRKAVIKKQIKFRNFAEMVDPPPPDCWTPYCKFLFVRMPYNGHNSISVIYPSPPFRQNSEI